MQRDFRDPARKENLIKGVKLFKLKVNRDKRGLLMETLKVNWKEIFNNKLPFGQSYLSITQPGFARDENVWHVHPTKQVDRFVILQGSAVFALFDWRKSSPTYGQLDLFLMTDRDDERQYILLIPKNVLHAFCVTGDLPCYLLGQPTTPYDVKEEGRIPFSTVRVKLANGKPFSWNTVRECLNSEPQEFS